MARYQDNADARSPLRRQVLLGNDVDRRSAERIAEMDAKFGPGLDSESAKVGNVEWLFGGGDLLVVFPSRH